MYVHVHVPVLELAVDVLVIVVAFMRSPIRPTFVQSVLERTGRWCFDYTSRQCVLTVDYSDAWRWLLDCCTTSWQWLECHRTQGNAVPLPPIFSPRRSLTSNFQKTQGTLRHASNRISACCALNFCSFIVLTTQNQRRRRECECLITW